MARFCLLCRKSRPGFTPPVTSELAYAMAQNIVAKGRPSRETAKPLRTPEPIVNDGALLAPRPASDGQKDLAPIECERKGRKLPRFSGCEGQASFSQYQAERAQSHKSKADWKLRDQQKTARAFHKKFQMRGLKGGGFEHAPPSERRELRIAKAHAHRLMTMSEIHDPYIQKMVNFWRDDYAVSIAGRTLIGVEPNPGEDRKGKKKQMPDYEVPETNVCARCPRRGMLTSAKAVFLSKHHGGYALVCPVCDFPFARGPKGMPMRKWIDFMSTSLYSHPSSVDILTNRDIAWSVECMDANPDAVRIKIPDRSGPDIVHKFATPVPIPSTSSPSEVVPSQSEPAVLDKGKENADSPTQLSTEETKVAVTLAALLAPPAPLPSTSGPRGPTCHPLPLPPPSPIEGFTEHKTINPPPLEVAESLGKRLSGVFLTRDLERQMIMSEAGYTTFSSWWFGNHVRARSSIVSYDTEGRLIQSRNVKEVKADFDIRTLTALKALTWLELFMEIATRWLPFLVPWCVVCIAAIKLGLIPCLPTAIAAAVMSRWFYKHRMGHVRRDRLVLTYVPHLVSSVVLEHDFHVYRRDAEINIMSKFRRLAGFPTPDRSAVELVRGSALAALALLESESFFDQPAACAVLP